MLILHDNDISILILLISKKSYNNTVSRLYNIWINTFFSTKIILSFIIIRFNLFDVKRESLINVENFEINQSENFSDFDNFFSFFNAFVFQSAILFDMMSSDWSKFTSLIFNVFRLYVVSTFIVFRLSNILFWLIVYVTIRLECN